MIEINVRQKKVFTVIAFAALIIIYLMIFWFSANDGDASSKLSGMVTNKIVAILEQLFNIDFLLNNQVQLLGEAEHSVRKTAHMAEYALIGFFLYGIILCWHKKLIKGTLLGLMIIIISAALDEIHQYFVPGRSCSAVDVGIDTIGGIIGMAVIFIIWKRVRYSRSKKIQRKLPSRE